jgi:hypothetical protein
MAVMLSCTPAPPSVWISGIELSPLLLVVLPALDLQRLPFHLREFVRKDLERNGLSSDSFQDLSGKSLIIRNTSLPH